MLLLQRAFDDDDPAGGRWEFPGGHLDDGEPSHVAACREWCEEVGQKLPAGRFNGSWQAGVYEGHVWRIEHEADVDLTDRDSLTNPDDPDGDQFEAVAWFDPALLAGNPALRDELAAALPVVLPALGVEPLAKATWDDHPLRRVEDKLTDFYAAKLHAALRKLVTPEVIRAAVAKYAETHQVAKEGWNPQTQPRDDHGRFVGGGDAKETKSGSLRGNADRAALDASAKSAGKGLDAVQEQALNRWTAGRGGVRAFQTGNVSSEQAQAFDSTMQDMPKVDGLVYRGVSGQGAQFQAGLNVGDHVHLGEPVSTSVDPGKAGAFGTNLYEIRSPAAAYIGPNSATPWEHEAVLAPGNYEVTGVRDTTTRLGSQEASIHVVTLSDTTTGSRSWLPDGSTGHMTVTKEMEPADHVSDEVDPDRESRFMEGAPGDVGTFRLVSSEVAKEGWNPQTQPTNRP